MKNQGGTSSTSFLFYSLYSSFYKNDKNKYFFEKVREIKGISSVEWDVKGDYLNADEVRVKVVADNGEYNLLLGSPALHDKVETLLQDSWVERVSFILLVNKLMELQGRSERFDVNCDLNITDVVKFAIRCTRK